jgi:hypothetical protein
MLAGFLGPWVYDLINVPAEYPCSEPFVRLEGDFCGIPMSGLWVLFAITSGFINAIARLATSDLFAAGSSRELLMLVPALLLLLPLTSTLLLIWRGDRCWLQIFQLVGLCLVGGLLLWVLSAASGLHTYQLWGPWLYLGTVLLLLILEGITFLRRQEPSRMG